MKSFDAFEREERSARNADERRFWMDCCIATLRVDPDNAHKHADRMLDELRKKGKE